MGDRLDGELPLLPKLTLALLVERKDGDEFGVSSLSLMCRATVAVLVLRWCIIIILFCIDFVCARFANNDPFC